MKIAAIDNGYWATKVYTKDMRFSFRSKYEKASDKLNSNNTIRFTYDDTDYLIGEGATMCNIEYDKTSNELHKICTYAALARLTGDIGEEFNLVVGYPLNVYVSGAEEFAEYLKTDGYIETKIDGATKVFRINKCTVFPQCAGAIYVEPWRFKNRIIGVLDFGGLTLNGCIFDNLNLVRESMFTENLGSIILYNKIKKALELRFGISIQEYEIPMIASRGLKRCQEESKKIINEVINNHIEEVKRVTRLNKWNIDNLDLVATGGTALLLENALQSAFPGIEISSDPVYDNVKGFYNVGELVYG